MRIYTVHERPVPLGADRDVVLVKEGLCWPAFLVAPLWALYRRLWLGFLVYVAAVAGLGVAADAVALAAPTEAALSLGFSLLVGFEANDWRRRSLARRGYRLHGVVTGRDLEAAEAKLFSTPPTAAPPPAALPVASMPAVPSPAPLAPRGAT